MPGDLFIAGLQFMLMLGPGFRPEGAYTHEKQVCILSLAFDFRVSQSTGRSCYPDRKSTRLNSSHRCISYAAFCLQQQRRDRAEGDPAHPCRVALLLPLTAL